jgi:hypothetical protein
MYSWVRSNSISDGVSEKSQNEPSKFFIYLNAIYFGNILSTFNLIVTV